MVLSAPQAVLRSYWLDLYRLFMMSSGSAESAGGWRGLGEERGGDGETDRQACDVLLFA